MLQRETARPAERPKELKVETGTVKWFNNAKGFGFITPDNQNEDLFVHYSEIEADGYATLEENQKVEFEVGEGEKGLFARQVKPC